MVGLVFKVVVNQLEDFVVVFVGQGLLVEGQGFVGIKKEFG